MLQLRVGMLQLKIEDPACPNSDPAQPKIKNKLKIEKNNKKKINERKLREMKDFLFNPLVAVSE